MRITTFLLLQLKRIWKNKGYLLLLLLFPVALFLFSRTLQSEEDSRISVGLYLDTEDELAKKVCDKLVTSEDSLFVFSFASSEDDLIKNVQNNRFECGYLFRKDLGQELDKNHLKNLVTVYVSETTTCSGVLNELVYANLFEEYSLSLLQKSLVNASHLPFTEKTAAESELPAVTAEDIEAAYRSHLTDGSTFRFDVQFIAKDEVGSSGTATTAALPVLRGLTAVFLLLCGFFSMLTAYQDEKSGLYARLRGSKRFLYPRLTQLIYLLPAGMICLLSLHLCGSFTGLGTELTALLCYTVALFLFYTVLGTLIRSHTVLCAAFPMILLCTLIFTPVIVDLSDFFPWLKIVRYVLPTNYYLLFF